jgi:hypothetical protein
MHQPLGSSLRNIESMGKLLQSAGLFASGPMPDGFNLLEVRQEVHKGMLEFRCQFEWNERNNPSGDCASFWTVRHTTVLEFLHFDASFNLGKNSCSPIAARVFQGVLPLKNELS